MRKPFKLGLRTIVIVIYLALFSGGLFLISKYQEIRRNDLAEEISSLQLNQFMSNLVSEQPQYSDSAREILYQLNGIKATIEIGNKHTAVYSAFYLVMMSIISVGLFLWVVYTLTSPLEKFSHAAEEIASGNFNIQLKEKGTWELVAAQRSFNMMSIQLRKTQQKLLEAEKLSIWKQFSRMLAHEIKNPLTPIRLSLERLIEKKGSEKFDQVFDRTVMIISQEVDNLQNLAMNFSNFAKDVPVNQKKFFIKEQTSQLLCSYEDQVEIITRGEDFEVEFDPLHFYQVFTNIIQNAMDAAGKDKPIELIFNSADRIISISDQGPGIEPENQQKIFEPYFTRKKKGIGLGLALVRKLVNINNGKIMVKSEINKGTSFIIQFADLKEVKEEETL